VAAYVDVPTLAKILAGTGNLPGTAAALADADLTSAIDQAQAEVDGRLAVRFTTPFVDPPQLVVDITADIAAYVATLVYRRGEPIAAGEPILLRYQRAQALLSQAAAGTLALPATQAAPTGEGQPTVVNPIDGDLWCPADFRLTRVPAPFDAWWDR
jgi:phage gp36-like protein